MKLGSYQLDTLLLAEPTVVTYRARGDGGQAVNVRILRNADAERRQALARRLRLAERVEHPSTRRVLELQLEHDPPFVVLEPLEGERLTQVFGDERPLAFARVQPWLRDLATALAAAHRQGLLHGDLGPNTVWKTRGERFKIDFTNESRAAVWDFATDVKQLGLLVRWL